MTRLHSPRAAGSPASLRNPTATAPMVKPTSPEIQSKSNPFTSSSVSYGCSPSADREKYGLHEVTLIREP